MRLAIDLGTSHTVAVVERDGQLVRALLFDGSPMLPSGVLVGPDGALLTGQDAERMARVEPQRFEPHPKRRISDRTVLLGDREVAVPELLAAVLRRVAGEAANAGIPYGTPVTLTCPAEWGTPRREVLTEAAGLAGLGPVWLVDEPIAAATYCAEVLGHTAPVGALLVAFDFGAGTLDVAVVRRERSGQLAVLATGGLDDLGGLDVDAALVEHLGPVLAGTEPDLWRRIQQPSTPADIADRQLFWSEVRAAKETLSRASAAPVQAPAAPGGRPVTLHITRGELDSVAAPLIDKAVEAAWTTSRRAIDRAGLPGAEVAAIMLVGGSSRIPIVASRLHARFGVPPVVPEQPELPVAHGGLLATRQAARPVSGPARPQTGQARPGPSPLPGLPSGPPSAPPIGPPSAPPIGAPRSVPFAGGPSPHARRSAVPSRSAKPARRARRLVAAAAALAVLAVLVAVAVPPANKWIRSVASSQASTLADRTGLGTDTGLDTGTGTDLGKMVLVHDVTVPGEGRLTVAASATAAYYATVSTGSTTVISLPVAEDGKSWTTKVPVESGDLRLTAVNGLVLVDAPSSPLHGGDDARAVIDAATGKVLWNGRWKDRTDLAYVGTDVLVEERGRPPSVHRIDLRTGRSTWKRNAPNELLIIDHRLAKPVLAWLPDAGGKQSGGTPAPTGTTFHEGLSAGADLVMLSETDTTAWALNGANGNTKATGQVPIDNEQWVVYGGMLIGMDSDAAGGGGAPAISAYRLSDLRRAWRVPFPAGTTVEELRPCAQTLVCASVDPVDTSDYDSITAFAVADGKQAWSRKVNWPDEPGWYVLGGSLVTGDGTFDVLGSPVLIDPAKGTDLADGLPDLSSSATAIAGDAKRLALRDSGRNGGNVEWSVLVAEIDSGQVTGRVPVGSDLPELVMLADTTLTVQTAQRQVKVLRVELPAAGG